MNNATLFKQAHTMTKQVTKQGDCYRTTFGLCLKAIKEKNKQVKKDNLVFASITLFMTLSILAVASGLGVVAVVSVFLSVLTLIGYSLQNELKKIFTAENIAGVMIALPLVVMFLYFLVVIIAYRPIY